MSGRIPEEGGMVGADSDLARVGVGASLMTLNLLLSTVPSGDAGFAAAAAEARILSRRIAVATADFAEAMRRA